MRDIRTTTAAMIASLSVPQLAFAADTGDPQGSGVLLGAVTWLQGTLLGTVATVVAVIAVAMVGFGMLTGRINWRHGGCCQSNANSSPPCGGQALMARPQAASSCHSARAAERRAL